MKGSHVPLAAAAKICEEIRDLGYGRNPMGPRLDCWGCLQAGGGSPLVAPARAAKCRRVIARYRELAAQGRVLWF